MAVTGKATAKTASTETKAPAEVKAPAGIKPLADDGESTSSGINPRFASALCYLFTPIAGFVFVLLEKQNRFLRFHAWQSLLFAVEMIILWIAVIVGAIFYSLIGYLQIVISLVGFIIWIGLMVTSLQGKMLKVPVAGQIAGSLVK